MAKPFEIRFAKESELWQVKALWAYSFHHDSEAFRNWYFSDYYRHKECLVAIGVDGKVYASLQLIETSLEKHGILLKGAYIVGVDVLPEARDEKLAKALMDYAEAYAKISNFDFLLLMPFEAGFYKRLGYHFIDYHYQFSLPLSELSKVKKEGTFQKIDFSEVALEPLMTLYHKSRENDLVKLIRSKRHFAALVKDTALEGGYGYLYVRDNEPKGYLFYTLTEDFNIREMIYLDEEARGALMHFILSHASQVKQLKWSAPTTEALAYDRKVDKTNVSLYPFMMAKIINPSSWLKPYNGNEIFFNLKTGEKTLCYQLDKNGLRCLDEFVEEVSFEISDTTFLKLAFGRHQMEILLPNKVKNEADWQAFLVLFDKGSLYFNEYF